MPIDLDKYYRQNMNMFVLSVLAKYGEFCGMPPCALLGECVVDENEGKCTREAHCEREIRSRFRATHGKG